MQKPRSPCGSVRTRSRCHGGQLRQARIHEHEAGNNNDPSPEKARSTSICKCRQDTSCQYDFLVHCQRISPAFSIRSLRNLPKYRSTSSRNLGLFTSVKSAIVRCSSIGLLTLTGNESEIPSGLLHAAQNFHLEVVLLCASVLLWDSGTRNVVKLDGVCRRFCLRQLALGCGHGAKLPWPLGRTNSEELAEEQQSVGPER